MKLWFIRIKSRLYSLKIDTFYPHWHNYIYINFFKEGFLFDHLYKSWLDSFILLWITKGSILINFTFINNFYLKLYYYLIFYPLLKVGSFMGLFNLNYFFLRVGVLILFIFNLLFILFIILNV